MGMTYFGDIDLNVDYVVGMNLGNAVHLNVAVVTAWQRVYTLARPVAGGIVLVVVNFRVCRCLAVEVSAVPQRVLVALVCVRGSVNVCVCVCVCVWEGRACVCECVSVCVWEGRACVCECV